MSAFEDDIDYVPRFASHLKIELTQLPTIHFPTRPIRRSGRRSCTVFHPDLLDSQLDRHQFPRLMGHYHRVRHFGHQTRTFGILSLTAARSVLPSGILCKYYVLGSDSKMLGFHLACTDVLWSVRAFYSLDIRLINASHEILRLHNNIDVCLPIL